MILGVGILLFIGWVIYELVFELDIEEGKRKKKEKEQTLAAVGKGTYIKLEWKYFCEFRDEVIKEYEEQTGEKVIIDHSRPYYSTYDWWHILRCSEIVEKTHAKLRADGYIPLLRYNFQFPSEYKYPDKRNWLETKGDDKIMIWRLRSSYEHPSVHSTNCWLLKESLEMKFKMEDDRNPYKVRDMKPPELKNELTHENAVGQW